MLCTLLVLVSASNSQTVTDESATNKAMQQASTGNLLLQPSVTNNPLIQSSTNHNPEQHKTATEKLLTEHSVIYNPSLQYSTTDNPPVQSSYETLTTTETEYTSTKNDDLQASSLVWGYMMPRWGWAGRPWWPGGFGWWSGSPGWWYGRPGWWYGRPGVWYGRPRYFYWSKKDLHYPQFSKWYISSASSSSVIQCLYMKSINVSELSIYTNHNSHFIFILYTIYLEGTMILLQIFLCMMSKIK